MGRSRIHATTVGGWYPAQVRKKGYFNCPGKEQSIGIQKSCKYFSAAQEIERNWDKRTQSTTKFNPLRHRHSVREQSNRLLQLEALYYAFEMLKTINLLQLIYQIVLRVSSHQTWIKELTDRKSCQLKIRAISWRFFVLGHRESLI